MSYTTLVLERLRNGACLGRALKTDDPREWRLAVYALANNLPWGSFDSLMEAFDLLLAYESGGGDLVKLVSETLNGEER